MVAPAICWPARSSVLAEFKRQDRCVHLLLRKTASSNVNSLCGQCQVLLSMFMGAALFVHGYCALSMFTVTVLSMCTGTALSVYGYCALSTSALHV